MLLSRSPLCYSCIDNQPFSLTLVFYKFTVTCDFVNFSSSILFGIYCASCIFGSTYFSSSGKSISHHFMKYCLSIHILSSSGTPTGNIRLHLAFVSQLFLNIFYILGFSVIFWGITSDTQSNSLILTSVLSNLLFNPLTSTEFFLQTI